MRRRSRQYAQRSTQRYASAPRRHGGGCFHSLKRLVYNAIATVLVIVGILLTIALVVVIVSNLTTVLLVLHYAFFVGLGLAGLGIVYLVVRIVTAISHRISAARAAKAQAQLERERVSHSQVQTSHAQVQVASQKAQLAREEYAFYHQPQLARPTAPFREEPLARQLPPGPEIEIEEGIPGMPAKGQIFYYRDYQHLLKPGQLIAGIRRDGSAHIATWADFKVLLILGASDSGKTTTIVEKCVCAVRMRGRLVVCDPHAFKPDSLTRRIAPLEFALLPGTTWAVEHPDVMRNIQVVHTELERRRRGGPMDTPIFLVIEELNRLMRDKQIAKQLTVLIEEMGQEARGYNIFLILCAQRVSGLADVRNSIIAFICHRVPEMESEKCIPARLAKYSSQLAKGQTFVMDADGNTYPLQQTLIEVADVAASVPRRPHPTTPVLRRTEPIGPRAHPTMPQQRMVLRPTRLTQEMTPPPAHATGPRVPPSQPHGSAARSSATWGEPPQPPPTSSHPSPPAPMGQPSLHTQTTENLVGQQQALHDQDTEELTQRLPRVSAPRSVDPFDALAAHRNQRQKKP